MMFLKKMIKQNQIIYPLWLKTKESYNYVRAAIICTHRKFFSEKKTFDLRTGTYRYFFHPYQETYRNERIVEVPIIRKMLEDQGQLQILEVGNVLSHYFPVRHDIVDKYEKGRGVINQDVVDYRPPKKYGLIVSISTLEHIGWDETPREPKKISRAIQNLKKLLAPGGRIILTIPIGYNPELDALLDSSELKFSEAHYLKRISRSNEWIETDWDSIKSLRFDDPFPNANGLVIGIIRMD